MTSSIWRYEADRIAGLARGSDAVVSLFDKVHHTQTCPFCGESLKVEINERPQSDELVRAHTAISGIGDMLDREGTALFTPPPTRRSFSAPVHSYRSSRPFEEVLRVCPVCGWWVHFEETINLEGETSEHAINTYGGIAALKVLDLTDIAAPMAEVRAFLAGRYEQRFAMNATLFEQTVASVFRGLGFNVRVTGKSGDDGIDAIMDGPDGATIGVQVKRYKNRISVAQIRELTGALVIGGFTKGIFVTTSDFESGGPRTARLSAENGKPIELYNADRFYEALRLSQLASKEQYSEHVAELRRRTLTLIFSNRRGRRGRRGPGRPYPAT